MWSPSGPIEDRLWAKVAFGDWQDCWLWTGAIDSATGYGKVMPDGEGSWLVHRVAYELLVGPIPEGLVIDHVKEWGCASKACVNPLHLEPVTGRENTLRGSGFAAVNARKTHCPKGHPYEGENLVMHHGGRECRTCVRERARLRYRRRQGLDDA